MATKTTTTSTDDQAGDQAPADTLFAKAGANDAAEPKNEALESPETAASDEAGHTTPVEWADADQELIDMNADLRRRVGELEELLTEYAQEREALLEQLVLSERPWEPEAAAYGLAAVLMVANRLPVERLPGVVDTSTGARWRLRAANGRVQMVCQVDRAAESRAISERQVAAELLLQARYRHNTLKGELGAANNRVHQEQTRTRTTKLDQQEKDEQIADAVARRDEIQARFDDAQNDVSQLAERLRTAETVVRGIVEQAIDLPATLAEAVEMFMRRPRGKGKGS